MEPVERVVARLGPAQLEAAAALVVQAGTLLARAPRPEMAALVAAAARRLAPAAWAAAEAQAAQEVGAGGGIALVAQAAACR